MHKNHNISTISRGNQFTMEAYSSMLSSWPCVEAHFSTGVNLREDNILTQVELQLWSSSKQLSPRLVVMYYIHKMFCTTANTFYCTP